MLEILENLEGIGSGLQGSWLIGGGVAVGIVGLMFWLGGLNFARSIAASGLFVITGLVLAAKNPSEPLLNIGIAVVAALAGVFLYKIVLVLLCTVAVAFMSMIFLAEPISEAVEVQSQPVQVEAAGTEAAAPLGILELKESGFEMIGKLVGQTGGLFVELENGKKAVVAALAAVVLLVSLFAWRLGGALGSSAIGTSLLFLSMILLLIEKGSRPITMLEEQKTLYGKVFIVMILFGAGVQLLLCKRPKKKKPEKEKEQVNEETGE